MKFKRRLAEADQPDLFQIADNGEADTPEPQLRPSHEQLRFISFGSGSSGNCAYIGTESCGLLIDAGVDNNRVVTELAANAISPQKHRRHSHNPRPQRPCALRIFASPPLPPP